MDQTLISRLQKIAPALVVQMPFGIHRPFHTFHPVLGRHGQEIRKAIDRVWKSGAVQRVQITEGGGFYDVVLLPTRPGYGLLLVWDIAGAATLQRDVTESLFYMYRDSLFAGTGGRFHLIRPEELPEYRGQVERGWSIAIGVPADIAAVREMVMQETTRAGLDRKDALRITLGAVEAVTNAIKHAGGGQFELLRTREGWTVVVADHGKGIDLSLLPSAVLLPGYSTVRTMGLGFTAMMKSVDRVVLSTTQKGSTVLLQRWWREPSNQRGDTYE